MSISGEILSGGLDEAHCRLYRDILILDWSGEL